nr:MAG TPA: hypothetical protein [Caudoviricetes sp.]
MILSAEKSPTFSLGQKSDEETWGFFIEIC